MAEPDSRGPLPASRLVDTNVLIVASAADAGSPFRAEGTPVDDAALRNARLVLASAARQSLANGLGILGVSAPEKM